MDSFHCPEYEELTIEEKLLVDKRMKEEFFKQLRKHYCDTLIPTFIFKISEERVIKQLKEENGKRNGR